MISLFWRVLTDPIFLVPMFASTLMCLASAMVGVVIILRKRALLGEALSHAAYPGIAIGVVVHAAFFSTYTTLFPLFVLGSAAVTSWLGLKSIIYMEKKVGMSSDSALCFVLSVSLGMGILIVSILQSYQPSLIGKVQIYLYGQAATLMQSHLILYGLLTTLVIGGIALIFHSLKSALFDSTFAKMTNYRIGIVETAIVVLILSAILIGMRSVGVILLAGMLIAPAAAARQFAGSLSTMFIISGAIGVVSAVVGNCLAVVIPLYLMNINPEGGRVVLPSGPMILIVAALICFGSLLFSPRKGWVPRTFRWIRFQFKCIQENILKALYKQDQGIHRRDFRFLESNRTVTILAFLRLLIKGWVRKNKGLYTLTKRGGVKARRVVRLHRLWEVYLCRELGYQSNSVHNNAEEMEHILTEELEEDLVKILDDPQFDPHDQLIPKGDDS